MANLAYVWGKYEQDVISYEKEWYMLSFCAKWLGGKIITRALCDYAGYTPYSEDDTLLVSDLWELFNEADIIIAHNGDKFDIRKSNTRFIEHGLTPPEPYKTIDTKKVAKKYFGFNSNKLDDLGKRLGVGRKLKHEGFELWLGCLKGDQKAWEKMKRYNKQDVLLLERIYLKLRPWIQNHPYVGGCNCGSPKLQKRGIGINKSGRYQRFQCTNCAAWTQERIK
jgi:hypothetical protein